MLNLNFTPFPTLSTERLLLRQLREDDAQRVFEIRSNPEVNRHLDRKPAESIDDGKAFIAMINEKIARNETVYWAITEKENPLLIGTIVLWNIERDTATGEIGFELDPSYHGKGIMSEAVEKVLDFAFNEVGLGVMLGITTHENENSLRLLHKFKFTRNVEAERLHENPKETVLQLNRHKGAF